MDKLLRDISVQYGTWLSYAVLHGFLKRDDVLISSGNIAIDYLVPCMIGGVGGGVGPLPT